MIAQIAHDIRASTDPLQLSSPNKANVRTSAGPALHTTRPTDRSVQLTPQSDGSYKRTILSSFSGDAYGLLFTGPLAVDSNGALYGTTESSSGVGFGGSVFRLSPPATGTIWTRSILHTFTDDGHDGYTPNAGVLLNKTGRIFGTTVRGGGAFLGTVYVLDP